MNQEAESHSPYRRVAIVLRVVVVLMVGLVIAAFALGDATGRVWAGIITQAGTGQSGVQPLPVGSVVILDSAVVGRLETVRTVTVGGPSSAKIALYAGRWLLEDPGAVSAHSAEVVSGQDPGRPVVIQLVRNPKNRVRVGEVRLNPFVRAIPVYEAGAPKSIR